MAMMSRIVSYNSTVFSLKRNELASESREDRGGLSEKVRKGIVEMGREFVPPLTIPKK